MDKQVVVYTDPVLREVEKYVAGQLADSSQSLYAHDMQLFQKWLTENQIALADLTEEDLQTYRAYLVNKYAKSTANRILTIARKTVHEAFYRGLIPKDFADRIKGLKVANESPRTALSQEQCEALLKKIDRSTPKGKRDYALLMLLIKTGIRRAELVALRISDQGMDQGYFILTVRHGKGDKRRIVKLTPEVHMAIQAYLMERPNVTPDSPLFVGIQKNGTWREAPLHMYGGLNHILEDRAAAINVHLTPHDLRATFATLALDNDAPLHKVQFAMGHADPRTTERYYRRRDNLKKGATDFIDLRLDD